MEIGVILLSLLFVGFAAFGMMLFRCIINPISVFCGVWGVILLFYSFHFYELYYASFDSLLLIGVGVIAFFFGSMTATALVSKRARLNLETSIIDDSEKPQYKVVLLLNLLSFVFLVGFGITTIRLLLSGNSFYYIHRLYNQENGTIGASRAYQNIITWYAWPLMDASIATLSVLVQCDKTKSTLKKLASVLIVMNLTLFTVITGKRSHLGYIVMYLVAVFILQGKKVKLQRKTKMGIVGLVAVILWAFNAITTSRGSESILRVLYVYLVGCVPHLSVKLENMFFRPSGLTSIYGFYQAPLLIINHIIKSPYLTNLRSSMGDLIAITQERAYIAPGMRFNAFLTPFYYFYIDGGMIGNAVLSFVYGFASMMVYLSHIRKRSYKSMIVYLLIFFTLYMSMVRIQFFQMRYTLSFVYVYLFFKKNKVKLVFGERTRINNHSQ